MWKPGTAKPTGSTPPSSSKKNKKNKKKKGSAKTKLDPLSLNDDGAMIKDSESSKAFSSAATPRKRLTGSTMNMRFMKRRKDEISNGSNSNNNMNKNNNNNNNNATGNDEGEPRSHSKKKKASSSSHSRIQVDDDDDAMDTSDDNHSVEQEAAEEESNYGRANSVDMHGIEAALIGRRSFRGFNEPIERIWKDSKACIENRELSKRKEKVSDEELLQRYRDAATERGTGQHRGVGNLDKKATKTRR